MKHLPLIAIAASLLNAAANPVPAPPMLPPATQSAKAVSGSRVSIAEAGAVGDGQTVNTAAIQKTIDQLAAKGGGTVVVPAGVFVSGALQLKPRVNLHLEKDGVLRCSTDMTNFPSRRIRIEGQFQESYTPALINALDCDGLQITGEGVLDGAGMSTWELFWKLRKQAPDPENFPNLGIPRITGEFGSLGIIRGNPGQTEISDITLENIDVKVKDQKFVTENVKNLQLKNVVVNGTALTQ